MITKRRILIISWAGWIGVTLLVLSGTAGAVTILPEGYDPSAPSLKADVGLQEEGMELVPLVMEELVKEEKPKVVLTLRKPNGPLGNLIRMADVCEIECHDPILLADLGTVDLAETPPPGESTFIYPRRIEATLRKMGMGSGDFLIQGPDRVAVETACQKVSMEQIEQVVDAAYKARAKEKGGHDQIEIAILHRPNPVLLPPGELEIEVTDMDRPGSGVRNVLLTFRVDGEDVDTQTVPVRVTQRRRALVAARDLEQGVVLTAKDLATGYIPVMDRETKMEPLQEVAAAIGANLKGSLSKGEPVTKADIEWIPISRKGEPVSLVKIVGNVRLLLNGNLQEDLLFVGQEVKVRLRKNKKEVIGKATRDGIIEIR